MIRVDDRYISTLILVFLLSINAFFSVYVTYFHYYCCDAVVMQLKISVGINCQLSHVYSVLKMVFSDL